MNHANHNKIPPRVESFGCTLKGKNRDVNADQFMIAELKRAARIHHASKSRLDDSRHFGANQAHVLLVADGVSDHQKASSLVVDEVMESILNAVPWSSELTLESEADLRRELKETVVRCNDQVSEAARDADDDPDMASTLTMVFVRWPTAFIVHAGASRAYRIRDGRAEQITRDHTFAQQMIDDGDLSPEKAVTSKFAHMLWNAVGGDDRVTPEITVKDLRPGDALLLCTDGVIRYLNDRAISLVVDTSDSVESACEELVASIRSVGGYDDATVAMARFGEAAAIEREVSPRPDSQLAAAADFVFGTGRAGIGVASRTGLA